MPAVLIPLVAAGLALMPVAPVAAVPAAIVATAVPAGTVAVAVPAATAAQTVCTATDARLIGLSGLATTGGGFVAISDSNVEKSRIGIFYLDSHCRFVRSIGYPTAAYDPEDLAVGRDGTLYVADIGDNGRTRRSIGIWRLPAGASQPKLFRYSYPDGAHDAEALLLAADDTPIVVTKDPLVAGIYVPTAPADPSGTPVPLKKVGTFTPSLTGTPNGVGTVGEVVVTGGANAPDRSKVALRTYSDAYEWGVPDGDVVHALTSGSPRITALPDEPQGESIAYSPDATRLYTVSDQESDPVSTPILRYPSAVPGTAAPSPSTTAGGGSDRPGAAPAPAGSAGSALPWLVTVAALGVAVLAVGAVGVARARRRGTPG